MGAGCSGEGCFAHHKQNKIGNSVPIQKWNIGLTMQAVAFSRAIGSK